MRFLIGLFCISLGISLIIFSILFFDFSNLIEKLCATFCFVLSTISLLIGIDSFSTYYEYKRVINRGIKTKAKIIDINRTLIAVKNTPIYILEVLYEHPKNHQLYKTFVDFYGIENKSLDFRTDEYINILVDPNNPEVALFSK